MKAQPSSEDQALAASAGRGDERAFTRLMTLHKDGLYRFVRRYTGEADEAYDIVQESFLAAWNAIKRFDETRSFPAWLRSIALNKCRDWSRRRAVRTWISRAIPIDDAMSDRLGDGALALDDAMSEQDQVRRLDAAIAALPRGLKEPLILTTLENISQAEAGQLLGMSAKAIELRVYRARKALAEALKIDA